MLLINSVSNADNVYYFDSEDTSGVYIVNIDGQRLKKINIGHASLDIAWSPNGNEFVYIFGDDLYLYNRHTGKLKRLTDTRLIEGRPTWSPDGKRIPFLQQREDIVDGAQLYAINADGIGQRRVTDMVARWSRMAWSPDGQKIAFRSYSGCGDIYVVNEDNRSLEQLTNNPLYESDPSWSPDGRYIAYIAADTSCDQVGGGEGSLLKVWVIHIMTLDGQAITSIASNPEWSPPLEPIWSPVPALQISEIYTITSTGANLNLRESPSLNAKIVKKLGEGDNVIILEGPVDTEDYYWWRIRTEDGVEGWAVEVAGWYAPVVYGPGGN